MVEFSGSRSELDPIAGCTYMELHYHVELRSDGTYKRWGHRYLGRSRAGRYEPKPTPPNPAYAKAKNPLVRTERKLQRGF